MPELPEVETVASGLNRQLMGLTIYDVIFSGQDLRYGKYNFDFGKTSTITLPNSADTMAAALTWQDKIAKHWEQRSFVKVERRAKYLILYGAHKQQTNDMRILLCHLGMSGYFRVLSNEQLEQAMPVITHAELKKRHLHVLFLLERQGKLAGGLAYYDARRFGMMEDLTPTELPQHRRLKNLGLEPLSVLCNGDYIFKKTRGLNCDIKSFLLNQKYIVGLGNIYAAEVLWHAGIKPTKRAGKITKSQAMVLAKKIQKVLSSAIALGGSSFSDFQNVAGELGYFASAWCAYEQVGKKCQQPKCSGVIKKINQGNRSSYYCPKHQH